MKEKEPWRQGQVGFAFLGKRCSGRLAAKEKAAAQSQEGTIAALLRYVPLL